MSQFSRVAWKEGQFLLPQHFQQMERSMEAAFLGRWQPHSATAWGLTTLVIDEAALAQGILSFTRGQGILSDGTVFDFPGVDPAPTGRRIQLRSDTEALDVYLALPALRSNAPTTTADTSRADVRFIERELTVPDDLDPTRDEAIDVATKNLRIVLGGETLSGLVTLKVCEVHRNPDGALALRSGYIPPCLRLMASSPLLQLCRDVVGLMAARAQSLTAERKQRYGRQSLEFSQADLMNFWYLHTLNLNVNRLRHLVELKSTHPAELYGELVGVVGSLSTFTTDGVDLPPLYRQEALGECFQAVAQQVGDLLKLIFTSRYDVIPLTQEGDFWVGHIGNRELLERGTFYVVVTPTAEVPPGEVARLPSQFRMSVPDAINALVAGGKQGGVDIVPVKQAPSGLPASADSTVFRVTTQGEHWDRIRRSGQVAAWVPGWLPLNLGLIGQNPREKR